MDEIANEIENLDPDCLASFWSESVHEMADELLLKALTELGAQVVVDAYRKKKADVEFYYS